MSAGHGKPLDASLARVPLTCHNSYYHSSRLRWNSIERRRGAVEDSLIDDLVEWSVWQYAVIRRLVLTPTIGESVIIACDLGLANLF